MKIHKKKRNYCPYVLDEAFCDLWTLSFKLLSICAGTRTPEFRPQVKGCWEGRMEESGGSVCFFLLFQLEQFHPYTY